MKRDKTGMNQDDLGDEDENAAASDVSLEMLKDHEDLRQPSLGLPADCAVKPKNRFLVLKPQIALRSEADENAIVLLAVEEISFKGYGVLDELALDDVTADVLNR